MGNLTLFYGEPAKTIIDGETVNATATVKSIPFIVEKYDQLTFLAKIDSGSAPDVKIELWYHDSVENAPATLKTDANWYGQNTEGDPFRICDNFTQILKSIDSYPLKFAIWGQIRVTGNSSPANGADTVITVKIIRKKINRRRTN